MLGTREYTLCSPFRANAHNSSYKLGFWVGKGNARLLSNIQCPVSILYLLNIAKQIMGIVALFRNISSKDM